MSSLQDENSVLRQQLNKVEDYLANARAERDDLIVKYNALNDRVSLFSNIEISHTKYSFFGTFRKIGTFSLLKQCIN
jgi:hypothetical protein